MKVAISGGRDPATPASNSERVARTLKRARHLVVADGAHRLAGMQGGDCLDGTIAMFVEAGTTAGLDTSCLTRMRRPEFEMPAVAVATADLAAARQPGCGRGGRTRLFSEGSINGNVTPHD